MLTRNRTPKNYLATSAANRVREFRARQKRNGMLMTIEVPKELPDALVDSGFLQEWNAEDLGEIRKAIERVLTQLIVM